MKEKLSFIERYVLSYLRIDIQTQQTMFMIDYSNLTNAKLAEHLEVSQRQVSRYLKHLHDFGYIDIVYEPRLRKIYLTEKYKNQIRSNIL